MCPDDPPRTRRPRYKGTHPRRFAEKYKELSPEQHAAELEKVMARGHTPAGTHRSIMVDEILAMLDPKPGEVALDATLGYGGHTRELLPRLLPGGRLFGVDVDPLELPRTEARLRDLGFGEEVFTVRRMNFAGLPRLRAESGGFDLVLADLGVSSMQIDNPARGFTWKAEGPLDLRLNPQRGRSAAELLASLDEQALADLLVENSDEPHATAIAREVHGQTIRTTRDLAEHVRSALRAERLDDDDVKRALQRTFQALRIAVNDELTVLDQFLSLLPGVLNPGGRVAILTFHSGEDRRVKKAFQQGLREGLYAEVAAEPQRASAEERRSNPRSTSAKLRWARLPRP
ncbi:MAG: 16S rRNA (cytosine(1402)-N(4))-methyltransferase RsmH [Geothrix sp.]|uniref:16S rRNA (cytosine(1402)-N(4))-methyltransferase RsmH n=1 Tax=Geothrix sp. TaxID=1962974 RepID=UPI0017F253F9|nr:16S rRNA (cytosine(1402)-N(4))-methyltransferase RsmH [Geothrix sp.]NWJ41866.1 16S rRNA (cytosine(1402)-N(4))-methyltransferase RsmH [Geothrix sp.]WIL20160.1 MAG: 16S rRNA (cytosine(1402)-N(4))-methyltransferase RsmH [Geothrix sp.]